jgi:hypothetical protein
MDIIEKRIQLLQTIVDEGGVEIQDLKVSKLEAAQCLSVAKNITKEQRARYLSLSLKEMVNVAKDIYKGGGYE